MRASGFRRKTVNIGVFDGINTEICHNALPLSRSPLCYNFVFKGGALKSEIGIDRATAAMRVSPDLSHELPSLPDGKSFKSVRLYRRYDHERHCRDDRLIARASDDTFYETPLLEQGAFTPIPNMSAVGGDCGESYRYNGNDVFLLSSENGLFYIYDGSTLRSVPDAPRMTSMCLHAERVFATVGGERNSVWFSDDFDPASWTISGTGAGFIDFDDEGGAVNKVVAFLDSVYIFRDYGILRLTAYGAQKDYSVNRIYVSSGKIYPDTVAFCGGAIMFLAEDGLYRFDGYSARRVAERANGFLRNKKYTATACAADDKYYLAVNLDFKDDGVKVLCENGLFRNNAVMIYDMSDGGVSILRGADVVGLSAVKIGNESSVYAVLDGLYDATYSTELGEIGKSGKLFGTALPKFWRTGVTDLGYPTKIKTIRDVTLKTKHDCVLGVEADGAVYEYAVGGGKQPKKIIVNVKCGSFGIYIKTSSAVAEMNAPSLTVDLS